MRVPGPAGPGVPPDLDDGGPDPGDPWVASTGALAGWRGTVVVVVGEGAGAVVVVEPGVVLVVVDPLAGGGGDVVVVVPPPLPGDVVVVVGAVDPPLEPLFPAAPGLSVGVSVPPLAVCTGAVVLVVDDVAGDDELFPSAAAAGDASTTDMTTPATVSGPTTNRVSGTMARQISSERREPCFGRAKRDMANSVVGLATKDGRARPPPWVNPLAVFSNGGHIWLRSGFSVGARMRRRARQNGGVPELTEEQRLEREAELRSLVDLMRPAVQADGGDLELVSFDVESGQVEVQLRGACSSCAISSVTLQGGVDRILRSRLPWVTDVTGGVDEDIDPFESAAQGQGGYVPKPR